MYTFLKLGLFAGVLAALGGSLAQTVKADSFTLQGAFTRDDQAALFDVVLNASSSVDIRSYGYAGGTTSTGIPIPQGGFDPVLTLLARQVRLLPTMTRARIHRQISRADNLQMPGCKST